MGWAGAPVRVHGHRPGAASSREVPAEGPRRARHGAGGPQAFAGSGSSRPFSRSYSASCSSTPNGMAAIMPITTMLPA